LRYNVSGVPIKGIGDSPTQKRTLSLELGNENILKTELLTV